ncbi:MAG: hypothetical protein KC646_08125 [Candidatus Cloacimonetes bacterium]|nr:hypothetical protein [Candidatus Cloacimonadota bacterium]
MKNLLFSLAVSSLIIQSSSIYAEDPEFGGLQTATSEVTEVVAGATQEDDEKQVSNEDLSKLQDTNSFGSEVQDLRDQWATNTILAEGITPFDFLEKSTIKEITSILSSLTSMVSEDYPNRAQRKTEQGKKVARLNKNKKNLDHTKENLEGKVLWELSIQEMMDARTKGLGDNQNDERDVLLVRDFLKSLKEISDPKQADEIWAKVNTIVSTTMPACNPKNSHKDGDVPWIAPELAKTIIDSFKSAMAAKDLSKFNWDQVASSPFVKTSDEAKHSYYKDAFLYGATVQVYLQLIQVELGSVKTILTLSESINKKDYLKNIVNIEIPSATKSLFNEHSGFSLDEIITAYKAEDRKELSRALYKQLEKDLDNKEELTTKIEALEKALEELSKDEIVLQRVKTAQTFQVAQKTLTEATSSLIDVDKQINEIGEVGAAAKIPEDSIFERVEGKLVVKASFQEALKNAKTSEDIAKLQTQFDTAKSALVESAQAAQKAYDDARTAKLSEEQKIKERNALNQTGNEKYNNRILNQENPLQVLDTPIQGKIHNIQTSLRVLNETVIQIGSLYNKDKITITGIRWENNGDTPLSYQIDMKPLTRRLKKAHKEKEEGFVSAKYVKLDDESLLQKYRDQLTQANNDRDAEAAKKKQEAEAAANRVSTIKAQAATLAEMSTNLNKYLKIESSYLVRKNISLNADAVKILRDTHAFLSEEEKQDKQNQQRRNELIIQIESFFTDKKIDGEVEIIGGFSEDSIKKSIQNRIKIVVDWTKDYLDFVTEES